MTRSDNDAAGRAADIPDLAELADRIDVVLAYAWIDRGAFLRDTMQGLKRAVNALPPGPARDQLAGLTAGIGRTLADKQADHAACLREIRDALSPLAELAAADLLAAADRAAWVAGLRDLADFLAAHPDLPVPRVYCTDVINVFPEGGTDAERRAGVDRAAGVLGVPAADTHGGHYRAARSFGPIAYALVMIPRDDQAADAAAELPEAA
jgi:hypothetical protein